MKSGVAHDVDPSLEEVATVVTSLVAVEHQETEANQTRRRVGLDQSNEMQMSRNIGTQSPREVNLGISIENPATDLKAGISRLSFKREAPSKLRRCYLIHR